MVNKPPVPMSVSLQTPSIFTNKEWVVPPRPKPGRKPAADTPPTKRKAQNRAAQRAFRERRAARVGDLEEQMKMMEEEDEKEQAELRGRIKQLETEVEKYSDMVASWRQKYEELETRCARESELRENAERELDIWRGGKGSGTDAVRLPPRHSTVRSQDLNQNQKGGIIENSMNHVDYEVPMGCGNCTKDSRCECVEQAFDISNISPDILISPNKRPLSPSSTPDSKRSRQDSYENQNDDEINEIDFTARFSARRPSGQENCNSAVSVSSMARPDPCGFCEDETPCVCAEMVREISGMTTRTSNVEIQKPTPAPPSRKPSPVKQNPCINGPGNCAQCLANPNSTLFCKTLAATRSNAPSQPASQAQLPNGPIHPSAIVPPSRSSNEAVRGVTLTCADTFATLSRHPAFDLASEELGAWMPKLTTVPGGVQRTAFEVEAASVMGVLRFFDRRFGRDA